MRFSPLFWPVFLKGKELNVLDETFLPGASRYLKVTGYRQSVRVIRRMQTRAIGQVLLVMYTFLLELKKNGGRLSVQDLEKIAQALNSARPTLPFKMLTGMVLGWAQAGESVERRISGFLEELKSARIEQAGEAAALFEGGDSVLTHCNVSGLLPLIAELCRNKGKSISFYATETRPYWQGSRLTAWELKKAGVPVTVITDGMAAQVMKERRVNKIITGADHLALNGDIANKIGTLQLAICAKYFGVPFYVLCPPPSQAACGEDIKIEVRPGRELLSYRGLRLAPAGVNAYYPAFDVTPAELITKHIHMRF
ncbi:MAG: S-methyl-5-thioribose-1-phosphate isomerase [Candidatus Omnitrophota bacterium]|jgi:methylthioribose-1-phosphate isomerase|nr:S-methyl-5-thioribose-1-phosphate isomerase [Candidatus Omnitrophota bacterium]MDD3982525.1 S-methyl-5-thioribose-1-phosphate isomerase [Candidatus Omnitrophota bacterium]